MTKIAIITGITGQDGSYLVELLYEKKYKIYGVLRRSSTPTTGRINREIWGEIKNRCVCADLTDGSSIDKIFEYVLSDNNENDIETIEFYNLAAMSHVGDSFSIPSYSADVNALGVTRILESISKLKIKRKVKFYQASTSEMFGKVSETPQNENTSFNPRSPYAISKLYAHWVTKNYRESYNIFACSGILFNHESPRRGITFVTKKITSSIAAIKRGDLETIEIGNLNAYRDWGHAKDYVYAMWLILQKDIPNDYVISSGENHTVREFVEKSFKYINIDIKWKGEGLGEIGYDPITKKTLVKINPKYFRPLEVDTLLGDCSKAKKELGWKRNYTFNEIIKEMMEEDLKNV